MATLKIEPGSDGRLWVTLTRFCNQDIARLKRIPGHRWNPERKQWQFPDTPETRGMLAEIIEMSATPPSMIAVKPKQSNMPPRPSRHRYIPGKDMAVAKCATVTLTTNPPHPLIKQVDDVLVLRGMA
jgi:hypothetical protein